jgi:hypothetical protein
LIALRWMRFLFRTERLEVRFSPSASQRPRSCRAAPSAPPSARRRAARRASLDAPSRRCSAKAHSTDGRPRGLRPVGLPQIRARARPRGRSSTTHARGRVPRCARQGKTTSAHHGRLVGCLGVWGLSIRDVAGSVSPGVIIQAAARGAAQRLHGLAEQRERLRRHLEAQHARPGSLRVSRRGLVAWVLRTRRSIPRCCSHHSGHLPR